MSAVLDAPKTRARRQYSDQFKAEALLALESNAGNLLRTSKALEIPIKTLQEWRDGNGVVPDVAILRNEHKPTMIQRLDDFINLLLDKMPSKVDDATLSQQATAFGITFDKLRLLRGESTENHSLSVSIDDRRDALAAAFFAQQRQLAGKCSGESELNAVDCVEGEFEDVPSEQP